MFIYFIIRLSSIILLTYPSNLSNPPNFHLTTSDKIALAKQHLALLDGHLPTSRGQRPGQSVFDLQKLLKNHCSKCGMKDHKVWFCLSVCLSFCLPFCPSVLISFSFYIPLFLSVFQPVFLPVYNLSFSTFLTVCLSSVSFFFSYCLSFYPSLSTFLIVCLSICLFLPFSLFLFLLIIIWA